MNRCIFCGERLQGDFCTACSAPEENSPYREPNAGGKKAGDVAPCRQARSAWQRKPAVVLLVARLFFPMGFYWMWRYSGWSKVVKISVIILLALVAFYCSLICFLEFPN